MTSAEVLCCKKLLTLLTNSSTEANLVFHTYLGSGPFFGFKTFNFNIFGGFQKKKYFLGYEDFVDIFGGSSQNWTIGVISMHLRVFS